MIEVYEKWPYWPPQQINEAALAELYRQPGYLFLSEAVDIIGRDMFGEEWIGDELKARALPEPSPLCPDPITRLPGGPGHLGGSWRLTTSTGSRQFATEDEAIKAWKTKAQC